jgi:hypothetical protein
MNVYTCPSGIWSIAYGCNLNHAMPCGSAIPLARIGRPSTTLMLADTARDGACNQANDGVESGPIYCMNCPLDGGCGYVMGGPCVAGGYTGIAGRHNSGANGVSADGHANWLKESVWSSRGATSSTDLWGHWQQ